MEFHLPLVYEVCYRFAPSATYVDDLVQESLWAIWKNAHKFDHTLGKFYIWIAVISRNITINFAKSKAIRNERRLICHMDAELIAARYSSSQFAAELSELAKLLTPNQYTVLLCRSLYNMKYREIKDSFNLSIDQCKKLNKEAMLIAKAYYCN